MFGRKKKEAKVNSWTQPQLQEYCINEVIDKGTHTVIAGQTGSGKSVLLRSILWGLCGRSPRGTRIILVDLKRVDYVDFQGFPHIDKIVKEPSDVIPCLNNVIDLMERRYKEMESRCLKKSDRPMVYLVIDELAETLAIKGVEEKIVTLGRLARAANIKMILATQDPSRKTLSAKILLNISCRIGLRCANKIESRQIINECGCESLPEYGYCIVSLNGKPELWEVPFTTDAQIAERKALYRYYPG